MSRIWRIVFLLLLLAPAFGQQSIGPNTVVQNGQQGVQGPAGPIGPPGGSLSYPGCTTDGSNGFQCPTGALSAPTMYPGTLISKDNSGIVSRFTPPVPSTFVTTQRWDSCRFNLFAADPDCGTSMGNFGPFTRLVVAPASIATYPNDQYGAAQIHLDALTGGRNNSSPNQKSVFVTLNPTLRSWTPGQTFGINPVVWHGSNGDTFGIYSYTYDFGNTNAGGDEGYAGIKAQVNQGAFEFTATVSSVVGNVLNYTSPSSDEPYSRGEQRLLYNTTTGPVAGQGSGGGNGPYVTGTIASITGTPPTVTGTGTGWSSLGLGAHTDLCFSLDGGNAVNALLYVIQVNNVISDTSMLLTLVASGVNQAWQGDATSGTYKIFKCSLTTAIAKTGSLTVADGTKFAPGDVFHMAIGNTLLQSGLAINMGKNVPGGIAANAIGLTNVGAYVSPRPIQNAIQSSGSWNVMWNNTTPTTLTQHNWFQDGTPVLVFASFTGQTSTSNLTLFSINRTSGAGGSYQESYNDQFDLRSFIGAQTYRYIAYDSTHGRFEVDAQGTNIPSFFTDATTTPDVGVNNGAIMNFYSNNASTVTAVISAAAGTMQTKKSYTVATLPTCNAAAQGTFTFVTDGTSPAYLATIAGGGAVITPVFCNGTNWIAH